jgi:hypothetical protein
MASKALSDQVAAKWQDSFNRLNRGAPGISGLMGFSRVRDHHRPRGFCYSISVAPFLSRPGRLLQMFCTLESSGRLRKTLVSCLYACVRGTLNAADYDFLCVGGAGGRADTNEVRTAFDVLMQCRMLPMLLESFVGAFLVPLE